MSTQHATITDDNMSQVASDEITPVKPNGHLGHGGGSVLDTARSMDLSPYANGAAPGAAYVAQPPARGSGEKARRAPSVLVLAQRDALRGAIGPLSPPMGGAGGGGWKFSIPRLFHSSPLSPSALGVGGGVGGGGYKRVLVEGVPLGSKDAVFFAPDDYASNRTPTSFVNIDPRRSPNTVYRGDAFEVSFLGISVPMSMQHDVPQLLLYSLTKFNDPLAPGSGAGGDAAAMDNGAPTNGILPEYFVPSPPPMSSVSSSLQPPHTLHTESNNLSPASTFSVPANMPHSSASTTTTTTTATGAHLHPVNDPPTLQSDVDGPGPASVPGSTQAHGPHGRVLSSSGMNSLPPPPPTPQHLNSLFTQRALSAAGAGVTKQVTSPPAPYHHAGQLQMITNPRSLSTDLPFIHYDPVIDAHDTDTDCYMPVPATKSLYLRCPGMPSAAVSKGLVNGTADEHASAKKHSHHAAHNPNQTMPQSVSIRFTVMEVDKFSVVDSLINAGRSGSIPASLHSLATTPSPLSSISSGMSSPSTFGLFPHHAHAQQHHHHAQGPPVAPPTAPSQSNTFTLLSRAFSVMDRSRPSVSSSRTSTAQSHCHSVDMEFLLADREEDESGRSEDGVGGGGSGEKQQRGDNCGNYLQYGYYFFLSDKVDAKLYAQTCSSSQSIPLLLKREGFTKRMERRNEKEYFPLNGVSYLVAKVSRGCKHAEPEHENRPALRLDHKRRLDHIMQMNQVIDMVSSMQQTQYKHGVNTNLAIKGPRTRFAGR